MATIQSILADVATWVDQGRKLVDAAASVGAIPDAVIVQPIVDGLSMLIDDLNKLAQGSLNPAAVAVDTADAAINVELADDFDPTSGAKK